MLKRTTMMRINSQAGFLAAGVAGLLFLSGCDTVDTGGNEQVILPVEATFTFEFTTESVEPGEVVTIQSDDLIDLSGDLRGFSKEEIVSAQVTGGTIERLSPPNADLNTVVSSAAVQLTAQGLSDKPVATAKITPGRADATLAVDQIAPLESYLSASSFGAALQFVPAANLETDTLYRLQVELQFIVDLEGL